MKDFKTTTTTPNGFLRFDRHAAFPSGSQSDLFMNTMRRLVKAVEMAQIQAEEECVHHNFYDLENHIYGLYDGYLYDNLIIDVAKMGVTSGLMIRTCEMIAWIEAQIIANGELETQV